MRVPAEQVFDRNLRNIILTICKHSVNPVGGKIANELSGHAPDFPLVSVW